MAKRRATVFLDIDARLGNQQTCLSHNYPPSLGEIFAFALSETLFKVQNPVGAVVLVARSTFIPISQLKQFVYTVLYFAPHRVIRIIAH